MKTFYTIYDDNGVVCGGITKAIAESILRDGHIEYDLNEIVWDAAPTEMEDYLIWKGRINKDESQNSSLDQ